MTKGNRYFLYCALLLLAPEAAMANLILPMISFTFPAMCVMLIAVILVEFCVLTRRWANADKKSLFFEIAIGNFFSTLFGIPIAWLIYLHGITQPLHTYLADLASGLPPFLMHLLAIFTYAPIMPSGNWGLIYINFILMLLPAYFLSYRIEYCFIDQNDISKKEALLGVRSANRYSYLFVSFVATIYFTIVANSEYNSFFVSSWHWLVDKGSVFLYFVNSVR
jgi:hypothetical protein